MREPAQTTPPPAQTASPPPVQRPLPAAVSPARDEPERPAPPPAAVQQPAPPIRQPESSPADSPASSVPQTVIPPVLPQMQPENLPSESVPQSAAPSFANRDDDQRTTIPDSDTSSITSSIIADSNEPPVLPPETVPVNPPVPADEAPGNQTREPQTQTEPIVRQETGRNNASSAAVIGGISFPFIIIILLILLAALIIGLIIFMIKQYQRSPGKAVYEASNYTAAAQQQDAEAKKKNAEMLASFAAGQRKGSGTRSPYSRSSLENNDIPINGPLMLSLFVEDQNTAIGRRNIHTAKSGTTLTIGGRKSDFLIFLVPMPQHIAEVHFDGKNCTFIPKKPKYFPDIGSEPVPTCIGKTIRVISEKNYELFIRIERFQDPLFELNRLMNSISLPGLPDA